MATQEVPQGAGSAAALPAPRSSPYLLGVCLGLSLLLANTGATADSMPSGKRRVELIKLVRNDCGSCHGMQLTGGLGLPLTPQALKDKPESGLVATILHGRPGTPMPPWEAFMTADEAAWIVENLKQGFPDAQ